MSTELPPESKPVSEGRSAIFGTVSFVFAFLTAVLPVIVLFYFGSQAVDAMRPEPDDPNRAKDFGEVGKGFVPFAIALAGFAVAVGVSWLSSLVGTLTGVIALIRRERKVWRPIIGLIVNAPVTVVVGIAVVVGLFNNG